MRIRSNLILYVERIAIVKADDSLGPWHGLVSLARGTRYQSEMKRVKTRKSMPTSHEERLRPMRAKTSWPTCQPITAE
jgi:hypothetical protein